MEHWSLADPQWSARSASPPLGLAESPLLPHCNYRIRPISEWLISASLSVKFPSCSPKALTPLQRPHYLPAGLVQPVALLRRGLLPRLRATRRRTLPSRLTPPT